MANFIQGAIKRPGALTAKAKAAGMTVQAFAEAHQHDSGVTGDECRFYLNVLKKANPAAGKKRGLASALKGDQEIGEPKDSERNGG